MLITAININEEKWINGHRSHAVSVGFIIIHLSIKVLDMENYLTMFLLLDQIIWHLHLGFIRPTQAECVKSLRYDQVKQKGKKKQYSWFCYFVSKSGYNKFTLHIPLERKEQGKQ